jgi:uncharacterized membrane protein YeaQ/YmgE (transglycosylase-associated protein family)
MSDSSLVILWIGFGIAAGLVAMILPFRRGLAGIATNIGLGVLGSVLGGVIGRALNAGHRFPGPSSMVFSAVGTVLTLSLFHFAWNRSHRV